MKTLINKIFIYAFLFLYVFVAFISYCHAIEFFDIGNTHWMSIMLAFAFELGLAVCLASILIGTNKKNNIAWLLLIILVLVQVIGNTYSVFKFISGSGYDYYNYLAKPMLFMIDEISQETVQVIISWIMGAILPIVALLMTEMVANGIKETQMIDEQINEHKGDQIEYHELTEDEKEIPEVSCVAQDVSDENEEQINLNDDNDETLNNNSNIEEVIKNDIDINPEEDQENKEEITPYDKQEVNENHNKFVAIGNKEPKQMFDELKKESLNI